MFVRMCKSSGVFSTKDALDAIDASVAVSVRLRSNMPMGSIDSSHQTVLLQYLIVGLSGL